MLSDLLTSIHPQTQSTSQQYILSTSYDLQLALLYGASVILYTVISLVELKNCTPFRSMADLVQICYILIFSVCSLIYSKFFYCKDQWFSVGRLAASQVRILCQRGEFTFFFFFKLLEF